MTTRRFRIRYSLLAPFAGALVMVLAGPPASAQCVGDCNGDGSVEINELILGVNIALGSQPLSVCESFDCESSGQVPINCLIKGVNNALEGCSSTGNCPLSAGSYTFTQGTGGTLKVATFSPFPLPPGATLVEDVAAGDANCVHNTVVPMPGGFTSPVFCVPALGYLVSVTQTGCGVGQIDSNGGSDYTVTELGDTSDSSPTCNIPQICTVHDAKVRIDITVGDHTPDTCTGSSSGNLISSIPVDTLTWQDMAVDSHGNPITFPPGCQGAACSACNGDGVFNAPPDVKISEFPQILDFTTDTTTAQWTDIDGDGCSLAGAGPVMLSGTGVCMDFNAKTVTFVAAGPVGTASLPYDLTFLETSPQTFDRTGDQTGATCADPPVVDFTGTATRCIK
jgi:hypothetical protein